MPEQYSHPKFKEAVKTIFSKARAAGVGASIHHIGRYLFESILSLSSLILFMIIIITLCSLFGAGMENSDAAHMVGEWGCNNIILGIKYKMMTVMMMTVTKMMTLMMSMKTITMFKIIIRICAGGDLVFFIDGLQKAVKEVKKTVGEDVPEEYTVAGAAV